MGRHRTIDREALLDAAERVVAREGAAHLTLEAVAAEAGISKASVLYDYKTKRTLILALIERRVAFENARLESYTAVHAGKPDAQILGRLAATSRSMSDEDRSVALNLCAALAQDGALREPIQEAYRRQIAEIAAGAASPRGAMLAFLAIEGLSLLEWFGFVVWPDGERERLLADIAWLIRQVPAGQPSVA